MGAVRDIDRDLSSTQLSEGLGVQNEQESAFLLEREAEEIKYDMCRKRSQNTLFTIMIVKALNHFSSSGIYSMCGQVAQKTYTNAAL